MTAALGVDDKAKVSDKIILRQAITAELDAVNLYEQMARSTSNKRLRDVLLSVAQEEKVHIGEFTALLEKIDKEYKTSMKDGKSEVGGFKEWFSNIG